MAGVAERRMPKHLDGGTPLKPVQGLRLRNGRQLA